MVGGYDAGAAIQATWLALELKLLPVSFRIDGCVPSTLEDHFCTFLSDAVWREGEGGEREREKEREMTDRRVEKKFHQTKAAMQFSLSFSPPKSSICVDDSQ